MQASFSALNGSIFVSVRATTPPSTPRSIPCAPDSATNSEPVRGMPQSRQDCARLMLCRFLPVMAAGHENLRRYQFGQLPEGEVDLRLLADSVSLDRYRHHEGR